MRPPSARMWSITTLWLLLQVTGFTVPAPVLQRRRLQCEAWCTELACGDSQCQGCDGSTVTSDDLKQSTSVNCGAGGGAVAPVAAAMASTQGKLCKPWCTELACGDPECKGCDGRKVVSADLMQSTSVNCGAGGGGLLLWPPQWPACKASCASRGARSSRVATPSARAVTGERLFRLI